MNGCRRSGPRGLKHRLLIFVTVCDRHIFCSGVDSQFRSVYAAGQQDQRYSPGAGRGLLLCMESRSEAYCLTFVRFLYVLLIILGIIHSLSISICQMLHVCPRTLLTRPSRGRPLRRATSGCCLSAIPTTSYWWLQQLFLWPLWHNGQSLRSNVAVSLVGSLETAWVRSRHMLCCAPDLRPLGLLSSILTSNLRSLRLLGSIYSLSSRALECRRR